MIRDFYRLKNIIPLMFLGLVLMSSCSSRKSFLFNTQSEDKIPNVPVYVIQESNETTYPNLNQILPGQEISIINLQNENLINGLGNAQNSTPMIYTVLQDSTVNLPLIGKTKLGGLTKQDAENKLNSLYKVSFLKNPLFKINILNMKVTLLGEFFKQGNYLLSKEKVNLIEIIGEAGGISARANTNRLKIIRGNLKKPEIFIVNLENINSLSDSRLSLLDGDIIYLEPRTIYTTTDKFLPIISYVGIGTALLNILILLNR